MRLALVLLVFALAVFLGGWLVYDGLHGLTTGDYVTPESGEYAGQLGPWSKLFTAVDLDPRSGTVMFLHLVVGAVWLVAAALLAFRSPMARDALYTSAIGSLWYLPFGTLISAVVLFLLLVPLRARIEGHG